jgi:hypothetical protein
MLRLILAAALLMAAACTPTFNWREIAVGPAPLHAMFPCKPDKAENRTQFPGRVIVLHATGCETGGAAFVVVYGDAGEGADPKAILAQWEQATLAAAKAKGMQTQGQYFARGTSVYQAVVYAPKLKAEMTEPFFAGLRFE